MEEIMNNFTPQDIQRYDKSKSSYFEFYSIRNKRNVQVYNQYLYFSCLLLEMNYEIDSYCEYPCSIPIQCESVLQNRIFDLVLIYKSGNIEMQRLVYSKNISNGIIIPNSLQDICKKEEIWCRNNNYKYTILKEIIFYENSYYLYNTRFLYGLIKRANIPIFDYYLATVKKDLLGYRKPIMMLAKDTNISINELMKTISLGYYNGLLNLPIKTEFISYSTEVELR